MIGTAYILALLLLSTVIGDPGAAAGHGQEVIAAVTLVLCTVTLSRVPWSSPIAPTGAARPSTR